MNTQPPEETAEPAPATETDYKIIFCTTQQLNDALDLEDVLDEQDPYPEAPPREVEGVPAWLE